MKERETDRESEGRKKRDIERELMSEKEERIM
jgi:hypothetical protein